jgi:2-polyprenyl-3-methyl-5-hydroxy-6-metoxy-1,4-benzoquinol methylase
LEPSRISPLRIFEALEGFRRTAALKTAIELDVFTAIGASGATISDIAKRCSASERGIQKLCGYLTSLGLVERKSDRYALCPDAAAFLDRRSPTYLGTSAAVALAGETLVGAFSALTEAVRRGGTALAEGGTLAPQHPVWVEFAHAMSIPGASSARLLADCLAEGTDPSIKILDIAGGHGLYGIEFAKRNPAAEIFAVEWPEVLAVAIANAKKAGVSERFHAIPGDALNVAFGEGYDLVLITNFLPDLGSTEGLLRRIYSALARSGRVALFELMLNEDRISPAPAVALDLTLLATTPSGETRTPSQLSEALRRAGFRRVEVREVPPTPNRVAIGYR